MPARLPTLKIGFVPLIDAAPLVVALECGFFHDEGLRVELVREPGWASIRDKVAYGELHGAHALAGLCLAISWGLGVLPRPCLTGFLLNSHGDAITISTRLAESGVQDARTLAEWMRATRPLRRPAFAVPHNVSSHHFLLRHWLKPAGLLPGRDIDLVVLPPSQVNDCLQSEYIDGFCVGEPFNTEAVDRRTGVILTTSADLVPMHPEKAFLVTGEFAESRPEEHRALISALARACALCDSVSKRKTLAEMLSRPAYLGIEERLVRASLATGGPEFHLFHGVDVNNPSPEKANWLVTQMRQAGMLEGLPARMSPPVEEIFRADLYESLTAELPVPA